MLSSEGAVPVRRSDTVPGVTVTIRRGSADDLPVVRKLLAEAGLPEAALMEAPTTLLVAAGPDGVVGAVAVEHHGEDVLLRSLVIIPDRRGEGLGGRLLARAEAAAAEDGATRPYLLTETAAGFFAARGYEVIERGSAPAAIAASAEWAWGCGETAVAMRKA
jgi:N-acetylglutamate synthase-like GNAT family acetyltransferase